MTETRPKPFVAVACGGTGGHLFPGLAVAEVLQQGGCDITLLISPKEVDQHGVREARDMGVATLPAVALQRGRVLDFVRGSWRSYRAARKLFRDHPPQAVLAMGGFTSAPPILAARRCPAATFLHESNTIPGRAVRWLAPWVDEVFVGFTEAARGLRCQRVSHTGTPVRSQFQATRRDEAAACRLALGLDAQRPVLLVTGGSQGARSLNELVTRGLPRFEAACPDLQFVHLTGPDALQTVREVYGRRQLKAVVRPFLAEMEIALGAATVAISRAGASSLAELAAMRVPAVLIPFPHASDNHQFHNANAFARTGAARMMEQNQATPEGLASLVAELLRDEDERAAMREALGCRHMPGAAGQIAERILKSIGADQKLNVSLKESAALTPPPAGTHELQSALS